MQIEADYESTSISAAYFNYNYNSNSNSLFQTSFGYHMHPIVFINSEKEHKDRSIILMTQ